MRTVASTAIRVGRATMLAIGVGVSLALVLGAATVAFAAVPGDPFKLGQVNIINNATTTLQGSGLGGTLPSSVLRVKRDGATGGPALTVDNTSTSGAARGVDVNVPPGEMPINVSPNAGKSDLNVDKLDGEDRTDFLSASRVYRVSTGLVQSEEGDGASVLLLANLRCDNGDEAARAVAATPTTSKTTSTPSSPSRGAIRSSSRTTRAPASSQVSLSAATRPIRSGSSKRARRSRSRPRRWRRVTFALPPPVAARKEKP